MKSAIHYSLILSIILIISELVYGIPFLGGIILSLGWQPLLISMLLYFIMMVIFNCR